MGRQSTKGNSGIRVFNIDNASYFAHDAQAFLYVELRGGKPVAHEYQAKDRWRTGFWTQTVWKELPMMSGVTLERESVKL
jgi:hypothetical protein